MLPKNAVVSLLVVLISASWIRATSTGFPRQDAPLGSAPTQPNVVQSPSLQNHNAQNVSQSYNMYGAQIEQHNNTYQSSLGGNIHGAHIAQFGNTYLGASEGHSFYGAMINQTGNTYVMGYGQNDVNGANINQASNDYNAIQGDKSKHEPCTHQNKRRIDAKSPTLNKMKKWLVEMENIIALYVENEQRTVRCANGMSNIERLDQIKQLLTRVRMDSHLLTELHSMYTSYENLRKLIAIECPSDKSYNVLEWISDARFAVLNKMQESGGMWKKLRDC